MCAEYCSLRPSGEQACLTDLHSAHVSSRWLLQWLAAVAGHWTPSEPVLELVLALYWPSGQGLHACICVLPCTCAVRASPELSRVARVTVIRRHFSLRRNFIHSQSHTTSRWIQEKNTKYMLGHVPSKQRPLPYATYPLKILDLWDSHPGPSD